MAKDRQGVRSGLDRVLTALQIVALILSGLWALFLFQRYEKRESELRLQAAETNLALSRQTLETRSQKGIAAHHAVSVSTSPPDASGPPITTVRYEYSLISISEQVVEVTRVLATAYQAAPLDLQPRELAVALNAPGDPGAVSWIPIAHWAWGSPTAWKPDQGWEHTPGEAKTPLLKGGGGTGELKPGETHRGSLDLLVDASPPSLVGFRVSVSIDGGETSTNRILLRETALVPSVNVTSDTKGDP